MAQAKKIHMQKKAVLAGMVVYGVMVSSAVSMAVMAEEQQKKKNEQLDWNAAYYNNSYEKYITESELGYYLAINNYLYFMEKDSLTPILLCSKPNCMHKDLSCQAMFQQVEAQIIYYDGTIYGIDALGSYSKGKRTYDLMAVTANGESRDVEAKLNTDGNNFLIHRNQVFTTYRDEEDHGVINVLNLKGAEQESFYRSEWNMSRIEDLYAYGDYLYFSESGVDENEEYTSMLNRADLSTGEVFEDIIRNSPEIGETEAYVVGILDDKLYVRVPAAGRTQCEVYACDLNGENAQYIVQIPVGQTVMDDRYIYTVSYDDDQLYVHTKNGEQVSQILIYDEEEALKKVLNQEILNQNEKKEENERFNQTEKEKRIIPKLLNVVPVPGSGQYGFLSCFFAKPDGQAYRSIIAFNKEKLKEGDGALQTIVEGSLFDMH